jgi:hypothetical protein
LVNNYLFKITAEAAIPAMAEARFSQDSMAGFSASPFFNDQAAA